MTSRIALAGVAWLLAGSVSFAQLPDRVVPWEGRADTGAVSSMSPDEVVVSGKKVPTKSIRLVQFSGEPREITLARQRALQGQHETALEELQKIDVASIKRAPVKEDLQFFIGFCQAKIALAGGGDKTKAEKSLRDFLTQFPKNYNFYRASELLGDLAVAMRQYKAAEQHYAALGKAPWEDYKMRASVLTAQALVAQKNFTEAQKRFEQVINSTYDTADALRQKRFAMIGKGVCLAEGGSVPQGQEIIEKVIAQNDPEDGALMGRAYNALGKCHAKAGKVKDAQLAYLHTHLLYFKDPDIHAEALYHLVDLWNKDNKANRANEMRNLLQTRYAGTRWASLN